MKPKAVMESSSYNEYHFGKKQTAYLRPSIGRCFGAFVETFSGLFVSQVETAANMDLR